MILLAVYSFAVVNGRTWKIYENAVSWPWLWHEKGVSIYSISFYNRVGKCKFFCLEKILIYGLCWFFYYYFFFQFFFFFCSKIVCGKKINGFIKLEYWFYFFHLCFINFRIVHWRNFLNMMRTCGIFYIL